VLYYVPTPLAAFFLSTTSPIFKGWAHRMGLGCKAGVVLKVCWWV